MNIVGHGIDLVEIAEICMPIRGPVPCRLTAGRECGLIPFRNPLADLDKAIEIGRVLAEVATKSWVSEAILDRMLLQTLGPRSTSSPQTAPLLIDLIIRPLRNHFRQIRLIGM
jgi:hypothetical protein